MDLPNLLDALKNLIVSLPHEGGSLGTGTRSTLAGSKAGLVSWKGVEFNERKKKNKKPKAKKSGKNCG
jgi:hypothetical protein